MSDEHTPPRALEPLLLLARKNLNGEPPRRGAAGWAQLEQAFERKQARRRAPWLGAGVAVAALAALSVFYVLRHGSVLEFEVVKGELEGSGSVEGGRQGALVQFSDGSELTLAADARTEIGLVTHDGADVALERGSVHVKVTKREGAQWNVRAGGYVVAVIGTSFDVALEGNGLKLDLFTGSVLVTGPLLESGLRMNAGQSLRVRPLEQLVQVQPLEASDAPATGAPQEAVALEDVPSAATSPSALPRSPPAPRPSPRQAKRAEAAPSEEPWSRKVASGRFAEVIALAERRSLLLVYSQASLEDLQSLADAARYARRKDVARPALLALRTRFTRSLAAEDAAFFMGRLEEEQGARKDALDWYGRYLAESPNGVYASQALGGKMVLLYAASGRAAAQASAREYLRRFPEGSFAATARKLDSGG